MESISVRNPVAKLALKATPLAPRVKSLEGQTLGRWWNAKEGGNIALERIGDALVKQYGVKIHKVYSPYPAPKKLIEDMAKNATAVISSTGD
jgi:hypothetical protein